MRYRELRTKREAVSTIQSGQIDCRDKSDPQASLEITVRNGGSTLTVEYNGTYIDIDLPKGFGLYKE